MFDAANMTDEQIDAELAKKYPSADYDVSWWWDWPEERIGFCVSTSFKRTLSMKDFERNIFEVQGRG